MDALSIANAAIYIGGLLLAVFFVGFVRVGDHLRSSAILIPALGLIYAVCSIMLSGSWLVFAIVESILVIMEILYFIGPYQVSGWAWPNGNKWKTPSDVKLVSIMVGLVAAGIFTTITSVFFTSFSTVQCDLLCIAGFGPPKIPPSVYLDGFILTGGGFAGLVLRFPLLWGLSSLFSWGIYTILVGCRTCGRQEKSDVLQSCWINDNKHLVRFASDTNAYHVSSSLYKKLARRGRGATYSYTLVTSLNGRQFIRKPPVLVSWSSKNIPSAYTTLGEDSALLGSFDLGDRPVVRLLGGDGVVTGVPLGLEVEHGLDGLVNVDVPGQLGVGGDDGGTGQGH